METEKQERESRVELVGVPLNHDFGGSSVNSHDDASKRAYFIENLEGDQISFGPFNMGHPYKFPLFYLFFKKRSINSTNYYEKLLIK